MASRACHPSMVHFSTVLWGHVHAKHSPFMVSTNNPVLFGLGYHADRFGQNAFRPHQNRSSWSKPLSFASDAWQTLKQVWHDVTSTRADVHFFAPECMSKEDFQREWGQFNRSLNDSFRLFQNPLVEETTKDCKHKLFPPSQRYSKGALVTHQYVSISRRPAVPLTDSNAVKLFRAWIKRRACRSASPFLRPILYGAKTHLDIIGDTLKLRLVKVSVWLILPSVSVM